MTKTYYQLTFVQRSPLRIGTGFGIETDNDVIKDRHGLPFIPGSSLAGVLRNEYKDDKKLEKKLFGIVEEKKDTTDRKPENQESVLLVSDATLPRGATVLISHRDGVGLNDRGTAAAHAKYDFEVAETEKPYTAVLELRDGSCAAALEAVLRRWVANGVTFGARTTRGYGRMAVSVRKREFDLSEALKDWLAFDPFGKNAFSEDSLLPEGAPQSEKDIIIRASLKVRGSFTVRQSTNAPAEEEEKAAPRSVPIENMKKEPVVPGTAWAGSFRHHICHLSDTLGLDCASEIENLFGSGGQTKTRSKITFSETAFTGCKRKNVTRNAIDRYTAQPRNQGLFTSTVACGGEGELTITLPKDTSEIMKNLLAVSLYDLHHGLLTFGGESSVGRGAAELTCLMINGENKLDLLKNGQIAALFQEVPNG